MSVIKKCRDRIASVLLVLTIIFGAGWGDSRLVFAESVVPLAGTGITFQQQFPNAHTAAVMASQFGRLPTDEIDSANLDIRALDLYQMNLTDLDGIDIFSNLKYLDLSANQIGNLSDSLYRLTNLEFLSVCNNKLTTIPDSIGDFSNLKYLDLSVNSLASIPDGIGNLQALETLILTNNELTSLPVRIGDLRNVTYFEAQSNFLPQNYNVTVAGLIGHPVQRNP